VSVFLCVYARGEGRGVEGCLFASVCVSYLFVCMHMSVSIACVSRVYVCLLHVFVVRVCCMGVCVCVYMCVCVP
jgi:hypothetical protein